MPYIKPGDRRELDENLRSPATSGELNYVFTRAAIFYVRTHGLSYTTINDIVGALDGAKVEFQRRVAGPYEDTKIANNGDVYPKEVI